MGCDVISAVNIVTGQRIATPENAKCYNHEDRHAFVRIVGDVSMGVAEVYDYCKECHEEIKKQEQESKKAGETCDYCKIVKHDCANRRDYEEGSNGPVYRVCLDCRRKEDERLSNELDSCDW